MKDIDWKTITFKTRKEMLAFYERHRHHYIMYEINIKNGFAMNYMPLNSRNNNELN